MYAPNLKQMIMVGLSAAFLIWTVARLSRGRVDSQWADIVYRGGVRYMGMPGAIGLPIMFWLEIYWRDNEVPSFWGMLFVVLFSAPASLWVGYWGGRMIASLRGIPKP